MKTLLKKSTALVFTLILLTAAFPAVGLATSETSDNLLAALNPGFETEGFNGAGVQITGETALDTDAHSGSYSLKMGSEGKIWLPNFPVKQQTKYTLSFWMKNSMADAIKFWGANNPIRNYNGGTKLGNLPDMVYGKAHAGDDIKWREVSFSFVTPEGAAMMDIAINVNALDEHLKVDDISLVEYDTENLLEKYNYDFDTVYGASNPELGTGAVITDTDAHSGSKSLSLPSGYFKFYTVPLKPSTNYTLSFWMKNSKADAVILYGGNSYFFTADRGGIGGFFSGELKIGEDPKGEIKWRKAQLNFTTPANAGLMNIHINGNGDEALLVDDICLAESGKDFGIIANGDFEGTIIPGTLIGWLGSSYTIQTEAETGNKYITSSSGAVEYPSGILGAVPGKRIKVSFKAKGAKPYFRFYGENVIFQYQNDPNFGPFVGINAGEDTWETYSLYINATNVKNAGDKFITSPLMIYAPMIDDVYIGEDKNEFGFYKALDFRYKEGDPRHYTPSYAAPDGSWANSFTSEKSVPIDALSDVKAVEGVKNVKTRAHIIPTEIATNTFNKEEVTLLTAVYKYDKNGNKSLVTVNIATDASSDGKVLDAVGTVQVPENTQDATYKVEAVAWNSVDGMRALFEKKVLEN